MNWDGSVTDAKEGWRLNNSGHINNDSTTDDISCLYHAYFMLNLAVSICYLHWPIEFVLRAGYCFHPIL